MKSIAWAAVAFLAAATPSPSPAIDTLLAAPPTGFAEVTTAQFHGHFTAQDYASTAETSKQSSIVATMNRDGFIDGYGKTWVSQSTQHVLLEVVLAFTGGRGAAGWLTAAEVADKQDKGYVRADTTSGLGTYYGAHLADTAAKTFGDEFSFVKGNDVFAVVVVSTKDDALAQATSQAARQFAAAPESTIPSSQWPENSAGNGGHSFAYYLGMAIPPVLLLAIVAGLIAVFAARRRRGAGPAAAYAPAAGVQLSPDGNYWWDGQAWRDAAREAPPYAQRSSDGALWWDGRAWRPVPEAQPPQ